MHHTHIAVKIKYACSAFLFCYTRKRKKPRVGARRIGYAEVHGAGLAMAA